MALPKITVSGTGFHAADGSVFIPFGVNYFRPKTGWPPKFWRNFNADVFKADFERLAGLGANCIRVFLAWGTLMPEQGKISEAGLELLDRLLELAGGSGLYLHPTGPDCWETVPQWTHRLYHDDALLFETLEQFWTAVAARYRGRTELFGYDLRNEPSAPWHGGALERRWQSWLKRKYGTPARAAAAWGAKKQKIEWSLGALPDPDRDRNKRRLLDIQLCREAWAEEWTRRQARAIKAAASDALVTIGMVQWSFPAYLPAVRNYAAFNPHKLHKYLDFLEFHFYPIAAGHMDYVHEERTELNMAYLEAMAREWAGFGKPVVLAEFGWYGGGVSRDLAARGCPPADEETHARYCAAVVETTRGLVCGWLNWGMYDTPEAADVSEYTGLFTAEGKPKAWSRRFAELARELKSGAPLKPPVLPPRPLLDWAAAVADGRVGERFLRACVAARRKKL